VTLSPQKAAREGSGRAEPETSKYQISPEVVMLTDTRITESEAIRTMRTHIMARHLHDGRRGLTVCSPSPESGCTFTAVNLAVALSQIGISTLLIDADLHSPSVENFIRPPAAADGLKQCIAAGEPDPYGYIHSDIIPYLSILYAGGAAANPQEILGSHAFQEMIERCLRDYDFTVVDCPPSGHYADFRRISSLIGYGIIVARQHVSLYSEISALAAQMDSDGVGVIGTVLSEI
jgi:protein-tyrosine kinase